MKKHITEIALAITAILIAAIAYTNSPLNQTHKSTSDKTEVTPTPEPPTAWNIPINETTTIDTLTIKNGQSLSDILRPKGISALTIDHIAKASKDIFDVRKIKSGKKYFLISKDSILTPSQMIYEESLSEYVVFDLDSSRVYLGNKEIITQRQVAGGIIKSSLWNAFIEEGTSPVLSVKLADIFAWTIDFFGIQTGDSFRVLYDALYVEGQYAGIGEIHAASITHLGQTTNAYYYKNSKQEGYFDDKGSSLRKAFLKAPLNYSRISSRFSNNRFHPVLKIRRPHHGVDYAAPTGTPVYSIGDGTVVRKGYQRNGGGNYISVKHNSVYTSQYMHLNGFAPNTSIGSRLKQGQLIGYVGSTGLATGPHLDFRIFKNGKAIDPLKVKAPPVEPIHEENRANFTDVRDSLHNIIQSIEIAPIHDELASKN